MVNSRTENDILFDCTKDILDDKYIVGNHIKVIKFSRDFYLHKGVETERNFSKDNFCAVFCYCKIFDLDDIELLPVSSYWKIKHHHASSPEWFMFFFWAKYPWLGLIFLPIISLSMIVSCARVWRSTKGNPPHISTSGKILVFLRLRAFNLPITEWVCNKIINGHKDLLGWDKIFSIYHSEARPHIYEAYKKWESKQ